MKRVRAGRRRQRSQVVYVAVVDPGTTIVAAGLRQSVRPRVRMIEAYR